jgi:type IV pilus assembly protein PilB
MQSRLRVRFRVDGGLVHVTDYPSGMAPGIISRIKVLAQADIAEHRVHQDGRLYVRSQTGEDVDLRASFYVTVFGENAVLRILRKAKGIARLDEMGFAPSTLTTLVEDVLEPTTGIVLVTGPTGSGKTTTLYAAVDQLNDATKKIITCEDPVEYVIDGITQCSIANRPGITFTDSLRAIVRQDPDIILIGEIRDRESAEMAIQSALTGHKVLSTFHTEDSVGALLRLTEMDIEPFLIASTVTAVLAQRLVRKQCPYCRVEYTPTSAELRALALSREELSKHHLTHGRGCPHCFYTGYRGRIGVYELLLMHDGLREAILQKKSAHEMRRLAFDTPGFVCLQEDGITKAVRGETTLSEVAENCPRSKIVRPLNRLLEMCA